MDVQETLTLIDHILTEIDLELYQWQEAADMMSFIGYNASFELWTNDNPPVKITSAITTEALVAAAGKELRVMNYLNGEATQVGTAVIGPDGIIAAKITEDIPELRDGMFNAFSISSTGAMKPLPAHPPFEGLNKPLTIRGLEKIIREIDEKVEKPRFITNMSVSDTLEHHPFFDKEND